MTTTHNRHTKKHLVVEPRHGTKRNVFPQSGPSCLTKLRLEMTGRIGKERGSGYSVDFFEGGKLEHTCIKMKMTLFYFVQTSKQANKQAIHTYPNQHIPQPTHTQPLTSKLRFPSLPLLTSTPPLPQPSPPFSGAMNGPKVFKSFAGYTSHLDMYE